MGEDSSRRERDGPKRSKQSARMRARTWTVATRYCDPVDYGIPKLPAWAVSRPAEGGVAFAGSDDEMPFIRAGRPTKVRR